MLLPETLIEIIVTKDQKHYKIEMTVSNWKNYKKKDGFEYKAFQLGFSQYKIEK